MQRTEVYREVKVLRLPEDPEIQQHELDELALEGWQLVSVDNRIAYLDRLARLASMETWKAG